MKLETLVRSYEIMGYTPKGLERDEECQSIIKWLYDKYKIHVYANYCSMRFKEYPKTYMRFKGCYRYECGKDYSNNFYCDTSFDSPYDAYFDALRHMLPAFRFQYKYNDDYK
jgi:hypothetical protein